MKKGKNTTSHSIQPEELCVFYKSQKKKEYGSHNIICPCTGYGTRVRYSPDPEPLHFFSITLFINPRRSRVLEH